MKLLKSTVQRIFLSNIEGAKIVKGNGNVVLNGRCPRCGDSKFKKKKRLYCLEDETHWTVYCHNCEYKTTFELMVKEFFPEESSSLDIEIFNSIKSGKIFSRKDDNYTREEIKPSSQVDSYLKNWYIFNCIKLGEPQNKPNKEKLRLYARQYLEKRYLSSTLIDTFYVCFKGKYKMRIIIPFIDSKGLHYNFQARDITPNPSEELQSVKYLFAEFDDIKLPDRKIYNEDNVSKARTVWICEGIIDSMFLENSIALCNANIIGEKADFIRENYPDRVWVLDSFWKDQTGYERTLKLLESGEKCFIMPKGLIGENGKECKDINDWAIMLKTNRIKESELIQYVQGGNRFQNSAENKLLAAKLKLQKVKI